MGSFSIWHWLIVLVVVLILFGGRGKISQLMGDFGQGLRAFKKSVREDDSGADAEKSLSEAASPVTETKVLRAGPEPAANGVREPNRAANS